MGLETLIFGGVEELVAQNLCHLLELYGVVGDKICLGLISREQRNMAKCMASTTAYNQF